MDLTTEPCPTAETLAAYLTEGALLEFQAQAISEHLEVCAYCKAVVDLAREEP